MSRPESEDGAIGCACPQLDQLMACVKQSEWDRAAGLIDHLKTVWACLKLVMDKALADQRWDWVTHLFKKCQEIQQANGLAMELMKCSQWHGVVQLMEPQLSGEVLDSVVHWAVQQGQWTWVTQIVDRAGDSGRWSEWLCQQAVDSGQWDLVLQLIERGVNATLRNSLLQCALGHQHVQCTATLMDLGVSKHCREEGLRQQIVTGHGDFVLEVVRHVRDPDLTDFVLRESMKQCQWPMVSELVKEGLSVAQMESVCDEAVADQQWTVALQLLRDGVSPSEWMVNELFQNNKAQDLLDLFPVGSVPEGLKGLLLMASVQFHLGDFTLLILQRESVSDSQLMEVINYVVHLLDKTVFLQLLSDYPRSRRVFKQKFVHQQWKESIQPSQCDGGEVKWIFDVLYEGGKKDLALLVAMSGKTAYPLICYFCWAERKQLDLKPKKMSVALTKMHETDRKNYINLVTKVYSAPGTSQLFRSCLFRHAVIVEERHLIVKLLEVEHIHVPIKDLNFAYPWMVQCGMDIVEGFFRQIAVKHSMKVYFTRRSETSLKFFIEQLKNCHEKEFASQMFRKAITNCVELNCADGFVMLCKSYLTPDQVTDSTALCEERAFAYTSAIDANQSLFISRVCEEKFSNEKLKFQSSFDDFEVDEMQQLVEIILEREAWHLLVCVSVSLKVLPFFNKVVELVERCVYKMLSDQSVWPDIAAALDQWIRPWYLDMDPDYNFEGSESHLMRKFVSNMKAKLAAGQWIFPMSSVAKWCVDNDRCHLALVLALVTEDLDMVTKAATALIGKDCEDTSIWMTTVMWSFVVLETDHGKFWAAAALMKLWPLTFSNMESVRINAMDVGLENNPKLASACEQQGLLHWAFALMFDSEEYILERHHLCQHQLVVDNLICAAADNNKWDMVKTLLPRCTDSYCLSCVLYVALCRGRKSVAEEVMCKLDPSGWDVDDDDAFSKQLLKDVTESHLNKEERLEMVKFCISAGLSSFQRRQPVSHQNQCSVTKALEAESGSFPRTPDSRVVQVLLASGVSSHKRLYKLQGSLHPDPQLSREERQEWEKGYRYITEAAATPSRLDHLARLAVSHSIGCQPGRSDRIHSLPVAKPCKDLLNFRDVLNMDPSENEEEDEEM